MRVSALRVTSLAPKSVPSQYAALMPDPRFTPQHVSFDIDDVGATVANAIRRTIMSEMSIVGLYVDGDTKINDEFIGDVEDLTRSRVLMVPCQQDTPLDAVYVVDVTNDGDTPRNITFGELKQVAGRKAPPPVEPHVCMCVLAPHKKLRCTIKVDSRYGDIRGNGARQVACHVTSTARGFDPWQQYDKTGTSVSVSDIRNWTIDFDTNGTASPLDIVRAACVNIIERLRALRHTAPDTIRAVGDEWHLGIDGTYTISMMLEQQIVAAQSGVTACVARVDARNRESVLRLKTTADPVETVLGALDSLIQLMGNIQSKISL